MPKKSWGLNPKVEEAREREASKKAADKSVLILSMKRRSSAFFHVPEMLSCPQAKSKAAEDALWADEKNNKSLQRKQEEEARRQVEAQKRAELKALQERSAPVSMTRLHNI